ncbi:hypothetical protein ACFWNT_22325 [Streptomyces sp. NPDC058409]|uniref:hypothetical protein n=1 Tax=Streptomyces sp. NPDC058409 TaxID=3346484 RepID=UPI003657E615
MPSDTTVRVVAPDTCGIRFPAFRRLDCSDAVNPDPDFSAACLHLHECFGDPAVIRDGHSLKAGAPSLSATGLADSFPTYAYPHAAIRPAIGAARHGGLAATTTEVSV